MAMILCLTQNGVQVFNSCHDSHRHFTSISRCLRAGIQGCSETLANLLNASLKLVSLEEDDEHWLVNVVTLLNISSNKQQLNVGMNNPIFNQLTLAGSSNGASIIAWRKKTLPRQALHNIRSKAGKRSRRITPATKLFWESQKNKLKRFFWM